MTTPVLETPRLTLRPLRMEDAPRIQALFPNPNVVRYLNAVIPWPYPEDGAEEFLRGYLPRQEAGQDYGWAIVGRGEEELMGVITLTPHSEGDHRGFWLGEPYWGQGYMKEAVAAVTDFAFDTLGMTEIRVANAEPNVASHRLKEVAGAEIVSVEPGEFVGGTFLKVRWRLTAEAWRQSKLAESPTTTSSSSGTHSGASA